jgi:MoxR-like ATPase
MRTVPLKSGKTVLEPDPYTPDEDLLAAFQGREHELKMVLASWIGNGRQPPLCPLLVGEPGVGKNRIVYELAKLTGLDLYILQGHEDLTAEDLACSVRFLDDGHSIQYVISPLVTAMRCGAICFIDEIGKIRPRALSLLVSVLDERRYIDSTLLGERIEAEMPFRFVAATNTGEVSTLPEFIQSRMRPVISVGPPTDKDINEIIINRVGGENASEIQKEFWDQWEGRPRSPSARDVMHVLALASTLSEYEYKGGKKLLDHNYSGAKEIIKTQRSTSAPIQREHVRDAFNELFRGGTSWA